MSALWKKSENMRKKHFFQTLATLPYLFVANVFIEGHFKGSFSQNNLGKGAPCADLFSALLTHFRTWLMLFTLSHSKVIKTYLCLSPKGNKTIFHCRIYGQKITNSQLWSARCDGLNWQYSESLGCGKVDIFQRPCGALWLGNFLCVPNFWLFFQPQVFFIPLWAPGPFSG